MEQDLAYVLLSEDDIKAKVRELGEAISRDYQGKRPMVVGILKGSLVFMADLIRSVTIPLSIDYVAISSYGRSTDSSGVVRIIKDLDEPIEGRHVLVVEDIVDTGLTLRYLLDNLQSRGPASLKVCTLLDKPSRRKVDIVPDYNGFEIPDEFVVGYGLDYAENYRNMPFIGVLRRSVYEQE
ncbi:MAG: hypoxanthine phosphoribosyltransferase [Bacillota bacterium]|nr:hypoxanthine phosphoribosyltransferase [Bacillota bacterium]HOB90634.1 hypoxanthine phosphoribosyltransferase [Bacillota bacterium]HPZ53520.1 hypoxanthine phosphoribosyltransferase [Bacillota bacterium]HQD17081.1 hypoxanthine phosphoribosyltransferase [Bacillota bacterium]